MKKTLIILAVVGFVFVNAYISQACHCPGAPVINAIDHTCTVFGADGELATFSGTPLMVHEADETGKVLAECHVPADTTTVFETFVLPQQGAINFEGPLFPGQSPKAERPGTCCCILFVDEDNVTTVKTGLWKEVLTPSGRVNLWCHGTESVM